VRLLAALRHGGPHPLAPMLQLTLCTSSFPTRSKCVSYDAFYFPKKCDGKCTIGYKFMSQIEGPYRCAAAARHSRLHQHHRCAVSKALRWHWR